MLKRVVAATLANNFTGRLLRRISPDSIADLRWRGFRYSLPKSGLVPDQTVAEIFIGTYEAAEIRFVEKYVEVGSDIIELGASLGIVSSHLLGKLGGQSTLYCIEANELLMEILESNIHLNNKSRRHSVLLNRAYSPDEEYVRFTVARDHTCSGIHQTQGEMVEVSAISLKELVSTYGIGTFSLVCDIEGSEIGMLLKERDVLKRCKGMVLELHRTVYQDVEYSVEDMLAMLEDDAGFRIVDRYGAVVFCRNKCLEML